MQALRGEAYPFSEERIWNMLSTVRSTPDRATPSACCKQLVDWLKRRGCWLSPAVKAEEEEEEEEDVEEDAVEVFCGVVGVPHLMERPGTGQNLFQVFVDASSQTIDLIATDVMRAAVAYKWQMYGERIWMKNLLLYGLFFSCFVVGLFLIQGDRDPPPGWVETGSVLFVIVEVINVYYTILEVREMCEAGWNYFKSSQNIFDALSVLNIFSLAPMLAMGAESSHFMAAVGTVLMLPKMASIARGAESYRC